MSNATVPLTRRRFLGTARRDLWWIQPLVVFLILGGFVVYATWAALQNDHYSYGPYLSPFYSPLFSRPSWWPDWLLFSPALLILPFPALFRLTCYYYRGSYYKAFWADPPACSVGEPRKHYLGERSFPLILQNVHRYFMFIAVIFLFILSYDVWKALWWSEPVHGVTRFGIGLGTLVLAVNVVCLSGYTLGCHSLRHLVGGFRDQFSKRPGFRTPYRCVTCLNDKHHRWAWVSLFTVMFADVYVRLCSMGIWHDLRIL
ncbi:MAG TPA: hypothetical protein VGQ73_08960 [Gemmatimonadales bacterium]|jgi:hypothetical protein|nr:hypothetical protein [Gemmatimonadales bacterium]